MNILRFTVPGEPDFKRRARAVSTAKGLRAANPKQNASAEAKIATFALQAGAKPKDGPVRLLVSAWYAPPRSKWRKRNPVRRGTPKLSKPDGSNILKLVEDALNGVAWLDDSQVYRAEVVKLYAEQGEPGCLGVEVFYS